MNKLLDILNNRDTELFLALNGMHNNFCDFVMWWASDKYIWIPVYILFLYILWRQYKKKTLIIMVFAALLIFLSDQISVHLFKEVFQRLRPCHTPELEGLVYTVNGKCGGQYGFYSSHASNIFAVAIFFLTLLKRKKTMIVIPVLIWAAFISYSRIYLGVHFPGDVIAGAVAGTFLGWFLAKYCKKAIKYRS
ncbi:MAG: phosphatase PAP2 family protein [Bacteroidales bacterium]|nr:phosphatase PAP2 family protein [Bacteroidales bacterium]